MTAQTDALAALTAEVTQVNTVEASAVALIQGLAAQIAAAVAIDDTTQLTALSASLTTNATALAAAVTANTPAAPVANVAVSNTVASN